MDELVVGVRQFNQLFMLVWIVVCAALIVYGVRIRAFDAATAYLPLAYLLHRGIFYIVVLVRAQGPSEIITTWSSGIALQAVMSLTAACIIHIRYHRRRGGPPDGF